MNIVQVNTEEGTNDSVWNNVENKTTTELTTNGTTPNNLLPSQAYSMLLL